MKKLLFSTSTILFILAACSSEHLELQQTPRQTADEQATEPGPDESSDVKPQTDCKWWQDGCTEPPPKKKKISTDTDTDDARTDLPANPQLKDLIIGPWSGEVTWDLSSTRMLYLYFEKGGRLVFIVNPYGPARDTYVGTWSIDEDAATAKLEIPFLDEQHNTLYWNNLTFKSNKLFSFTGGFQEGTTTMRYGTSPPREGLFAEVYTFSEEQEDTLYYTPTLSYRLYLDGTLSMLREETMLPRCYDWVYGVTDFNFKAGANFSISQISGFNRYGGSLCKAKDRFIIDFYGSIDLPAGRSRIRFNTEENQIDDAAILFIDDESGRTGVVEDLNTNNAALCDSEDYHIYCMCDSKGQNCLRNNRVYDIDAGTSGGTFPIEIIYIEVEDSVFMNVELAVGGTNNFAPIPKELISYPYWWDED